MANADNPRGFWPIRNFCAPNPYRVKAGQTINKNEVVMYTSSSYVLQATAGAAADLIVGIAASKATAAASSNSTTVMVWDDPNITFGVQTTTGTNYTKAMEGAYCDHVAGSGSNGVATDELNIGSLASASSASATAMFKILRHIPRPDNSVSAAHCDVEVIFNEHSNKGTGTIGGGPA